MKIMSHILWVPVNIKKQSYGMLSRFPFNPG
jgi:hypothetical protein